MSVPLVAVSSPRKLEVAKSAGLGGDIVVRGEREGNRYE